MRMMRKWKFNAVLSTFFGSPTLVLFQFGLWVPTQRLYGVQ